MPTVAAIDIGTNSTNMLIRDDVARYERITTVTRLGEGVSATGLLSQPAVDRTLVAIGAYGQLLQREAISDLVVVATSACRDASNREPFFDSVQAILGVRPQLLSGVDEGRTAYVGAVSGLDGIGGTHLVFDIGGGSTELMLAGDDGLRSTQSLNIGALRLRETELHHDPPKPEELTNAIGRVHDELDDAIRAFPEILQAPTVIGLGGTVSTVARVELGRYEQQLHGLRLSRDSVEDVFRTLATEQLSDRVFNPGLSADRADIIVGGCCVLVAILRRLRIDEMIVSKRGLLDGLTATSLARR
jgi:exopolyphosphatase / guanosine-5'-triphosphate,3'-diphosphate pyrophosphatase